MVPLLKAGGRRFIPNICYAIAVGMWLTWRYRDEDSPGKRVQGRN